MKKQGVETLLLAASLIIVGSLALARAERKIYYPAHEVTQALDLSINRKKR